MRFFLASIAAIVVLTTAAQAGPFELVRIGDIDGIGYGNGGAWKRTTGASVNVDGVGTLGAGDFLADRNVNGSVALNSGDDFDHRSASEKTGGAFQTAGGVSGVSVSGSDFTDISLSKSFDTTFATPNDFPSSPSSTLSNQPGFSFDFFVATGDIVDGQDVFFNMVFGDYDVAPARIDFKRLNGSSFSKSISTQSGAADGLIQARFATLAFGDVFTATTGGYRGYLKVDFNAPREPYTAFDFVELSVRPISLQGANVPEPSTFVLIGFAAAGLAWRRRRSRK